MKKEAITHGVLEDLANRNDNWDKLDGVPEKVTELYESRLILKNEIVNGDFSNGSVGWSLVGLTMAGNTLTSTGLQNYPRISQDTSNKTVLGDKLYVNFKGKALTKLNNFYVAYRGTTSTTGFKVMGTRKNYAMNEDINISHISTLGDTEQTHIQVAIPFIQSEQETNFSFNIENWFLINLTQTFGAGNEPTKEEMDALIEITGYIDGEYILSNLELVNWLLSLIRNNTLSITSLGGTI